MALVIMTCAMFSAVTVMPIAKWHEYLGGDATADAIMDRLVHTSDKIELKGGSMRAKKKG